MLMALGRPLRLCGGVLATGLLLSGCSVVEGGGTAEPAGSEHVTASGDTRSSPAQSPASTPAPTPSASATGLDFTPDPARAPKTRAEGLRLARAIAAVPVDLGPGFVKRSPYESDPAFWPVLNANCVWQREPLPATVLASLTRYSEVPAEDGKGPIRIAAVVTVHRTATSADWEMAETLEEALRCPDQQLRQGERISGLFSQSSAFGLVGNVNSEDALTESGKYYSDELGGPYYYYWIQNRLAQVTMAVVGRGAKGRTEDEVDAAILQGTSRMLNLAKSELEAPE